mmetsp:Transcript_19937/g.23641  ORF Transcript_19937/g.23641 Transcript_19937/m.23641 type:complete len:382 (+) Transcript_19937:164-1309(+)
MAVRRTRADSNRDILGMSLQDSREVEECGDQRDQRCGSAPGRGGNRQRRPPYVYGSKRKGEGSSSSLRSTSPMREERGRPRVSSRHYDEGEEGIGQRRMGGEHARRGGRAGQSEDVARGAGKRRGREEQSQREEGEGVLQRFGRETQEEKEEKEESREGRKIQGKEGCEEEEDQRRKKASGPEDSGGLFLRNRPGPRGQSSVPNQEKSKEKDEEEEERWKQWRRRIVIKQLLFNKRSQHRRRHLPGRAQGETTRPSGTGSSELHHHQSDARAAVDRPRHNNVPGFPRSATGGAAVLSRTSSTKTRRRRHAGGLEHLLGGGFTTSWPSGRGHRHSPAESQGPRTNRGRCLLGSGTTSGVSATGKRTALDACRDATSCERGVA